MTIIFFGSDPWFSPPVLEALVKAGHEVPIVVTKGDALNQLKIEKGKLKKGTTFIRAHHPGDISLSSFISHLLSHPDVIVLASFGPPFLSDELLHWPKYGCLNVHASLLPRWRGASPVFAALAAGDRETGVSIMKMAEEIDRGPVLKRMRLSIRQPGKVSKVPNVSKVSEARPVGGARAFDTFDTRESLTRRLGLLGGELLVETLKKLELNTIKEHEQPKKSPTPYTRRLTKDSGRIDWRFRPGETSPERSRRIERFIRAVTPWPGATTSVEWKDENGKLKKLKEIKVLNAHIFQLSTFNFQLIPDLVQLPGKNPIIWKQFLAGHPDATLE